MKYLHSMIRVSDLDKTLNLFCNLLGFTEVRRSEYEAGRFTLVFLATPNDIEQFGREQAPKIELTYNWDETGYSSGRNFGHLAYEVDDIYQTCQKLKDAGIVINRPPRDGRMAFIRSDDNISLELLQSGPALEIIEPWASMPSIGEW